MARYTYKVIKSHLVEFDEVIFNQRYTEILDKYDLIVGDFSGGQLRLKGFYYSDRKNVSLEHKSLIIPEYLVEYCAYGCPYYILEKQAPLEKPVKKSSKNEQDSVKGPSKQKQPVSEKTDNTEKEN